ncbi:amino acid ABC transporter permease [Treponema phagedenis]|uniref:amino acid ABC transporter permease n=1 Tax=Treponema phagedenis TaxID=162 RepID=UPI0011E7EB16|nr:amino acid ABC transporter permease [Treponema phagedenis]QEJ93761.1 amino acid ABC transporter permease [Treponema phagedenis]QEJ99722.1 amino acid ABC transporter permease [Treponema phagedenis]
MTKKSFRQVAAGIPWWLVIISFLGLYFLVAALVNESYRSIFFAVASGLITTLLVAIVAYILSIFFGLLLGLARASHIRWLKELVTVYIELVRGLPMLVILYYIAFVAVPAISSVLNAVFAPLINAEIMEGFSPRSFSFALRAIIALVLGYSAFIAEIFRAGIESVDKGQVEAASALGLTKTQTMIHIILPQATRNILPALANEFIAVIKDSSLVSVLGVQDITQIGKVYSSATFLFFETYNVVAFFYLCLTISLSIAVRRLERKLKKGKR